ncbi:MAG TPA: hypothetical protein VNO82_19370, partial [Solirubrobacteraceae bacterium]|nr:hypothetical protein [Solirubrobacteraceae bacterium]
MSESHETATDWPPVRRPRFPLAALGPVRRRRRLALILPALALLALAAGLLAGRGGEPPSRAAELAPHDTALFVRAARGEDSERLLVIARQFPSLEAMRQRLLGDGAVGPWLGDELAIAVTAGGPLMLAAVADRPAAERFRRGLPDGTESAFAGDFL